MIRSLSIQNFKSIKKTSFGCKKLNVFIGEPNSGKSNILEALALKSQNAVNDHLNKEIFRYKTLGDLFFDFDINTPILVETDFDALKLEYAAKDKVPENKFNLYPKAQLNVPESPIKIEHDGKIAQHGRLFDTNIKFYEYKRLKEFKANYFPHLTVPFGDNLPGLLLSNSQLKKWVTEFLLAKGLTLTLKPTENDLSVSKFKDQEIYSYPYFSISETLQRVIFYNLAIMSNEESTLLFDEPESNTFPFYTKYLAERIALDETNQFFITTHNPYLLLSLIEKTPMNQLNVCIVTMKDYQTEVKQLNENQISKVLDLNSDVFFNFNQILDS